MKKIFSNILLDTLLVTVLIYLPAFAREVEFGWEPMEGAESYELQISLEPKFEKPLASHKIDKPALTIPLDMGRYFYRVRVIDKKKRAGHWSASQPVVVSPYPPELLSPKTGFETSYFEVLPTIKFDWKPVTGEVEYDVFIYKTTGQKILEERVRGIEFSTDKLAEGEYLWKVRTIAQKIYVSDYCEPRHIQVSKKPLKAPKLISPIENGNTIAYQSARFTWEQDPATQFTDLTIERLPNAYNNKAMKKTFENLSGSSHVVDYIDAGDYAWSIRTKEAKTTRGLSEGPQSFHARDDILSAGNFTVEYGMSPTYYNLEAKSTQRISPEVSTTSSESAKFQSLLLGYYPFEAHGIFVQNRTGELNLQGNASLNQVSDITYRYRGGGVGYTQEFLLGYRQEDMYELAGSRYNQLVAYGPLIGTRVIGTPMTRWRLVIAVNYFKSGNTRENLGIFNSDQLEAQVGMKTIIFDRLWIGWRIGYTRTAAQFKANGTTDSEVSSWTSTRMEPLFLSLSLEQ